MTGLVRIIPIPDNIKYNSLYKAKRLFYLRQNADYTSVYEIKKHDVFVPLFIKEIYLYGYSFKHKTRMIMLHISSDFDYYYEQIEESDDNASTR